MFTKVRQKKTYIYILEKNCLVNELLAQIEIKNHYIFLYLSSNLITNQEKIIAINFTDTIQYIIIFMYIYTFYQIIINQSISYTIFKY